MTKEQIYALLERVRSWPRARREDAALLLLAMELDASRQYVLSSVERQDLEAALAESDSEYASDADLNAVFR